MLVFSPHHMFLFIEEKYIILEGRTAGTIGTPHFQTFINHFTSFMFYKLIQSNNKRNKRKGYGLLRESLDLQNNKKCLSFHNIQHVYSMSRITLK